MTNKDVELIEVIRTTLTRHGNGTSDNPIRRVVEYARITDGRMP